MSNKHSLSGYTKIYTINQLSKSFSKGDYDSSCFWSVEMRISIWMDILVGSNNQLLCSKYTSM